MYAVTPFLQNYHFNSLQCFFSLPKQNYIKPLIVFVQIQVKDSVYDNHIVALFSYKNLQTFDNRSITLNTGNNLTITLKQSTRNGLN